MGVSVVVPTVKPDVLIMHQLAFDDRFNDVVFVSNLPIAKARNVGVRLAINDLILMVDDDVTVSSEFLETIFSLPPGTILMHEGLSWCISRVMAFHKRDYWRVGGFDEAVKYGGSDRNFYFDALVRGLKVRKIPSKFVYHQPHEHRHKNLWIATRSIFDGVRCFYKHLKFWRNFAYVELVKRLAQLQFRTMLLWFIGLVFVPIYDKLREWDEILREDYY